MTRWRIVLPLLAGCVAGSEGDAADTDVSASVPAVPDPTCAVLGDRPPPHDDTWSLVEGSSEDVTVGVVPAAGWNGYAWFLSVGPKASCSPCTVLVPAKAALDAAVPELTAFEVELACDAEPARPQTTGGVFVGLRFQVYRAGLPPLPPGVPVSVDPVRDAIGCDRVSGATFSTEEPWSPDLDVLEEGRYLTHRVALGPVVERAGGSAVNDRLGSVDLYLDVFAVGGWSGWVELGRTMLDACP